MEKMEKIYQYLAGINLFKAMGVHKTVMNTNGSIGAVTKLCPSVTNCFLDLSKTDKDF